MSAFSPNLLNCSFSLANHIPVEKFLLFIYLHSPNYCIFFLSSLVLGTKEDGYLAYYEICQAVQDEDGWDVETPYPGVMGPYAHKDKLWVGFDDEFIVREKAHFVVEENLGGIMFWTIDNDDFRSACGPRSFPLIESAKEALYGKDAAIRT